MSATAANPSVADLEVVRAVLADESLQGRAFCDAYTQAVDRWLAAVFAEQCLAAGIAGASDIALVAIGGHGRSELCPQSDLDLLLVGSDKMLAALAGTFWYPLWDARFSVGHAARTVGETVQLARTDLDTTTALISARHLAGDTAVTDSLISDLQAQRSKRGAAQLRALAEYVDARRSVAGEVAHELEPDLKEGKGGLRDHHALAWARALGATVLPDDVERTDAAHDVLLAARIELHRLTGRAGDRLVLQEQPAIADRLYGGDQPQMMRAIAGAARDLAWVTDQTWATIRKTRRMLGGVKDRVCRDDPDLGDSVVIGGGTVGLVAQSDDPRDALRVAAVSSERGLPIRRTTLDRLHALPPLPEPWSPDARRLFVRILLAGDRTVETLESLDRAGVMVQLVPEWEGVQYRPQRNPYHRWNVDRHLAETAAIASTLIGRVQRPDLLALGAIFHDIGKGQKGDHSKVGAAIAKTICERMGYDAYESETVELLVREHLLLPDIATRRDLDDPATIALVAERVGSIPRLQLLAAIAEADGRATGSSAWGPWKAELVHDLVERATGALDPAAADPSELPTFPGPELTAIADRLEPVIEGSGDLLMVCWPDAPGVFSRVAGALALHGVEIRTAAAGSRGSMAVEEFYIRTETGDAPDWAALTASVRAALSGRLALRARLAERARTHRRRVTDSSDIPPAVNFDRGSAATIIEVAAPNSIGLLFRLTAALAELSLDIRTARVATIGGAVVDAFYCVDSDGEPIEDPEYRKEIAKALLAVAAG